MTIAFVLLDETGGAATAGGEVLDAGKLASAATILAVYLNRDVGGYWGIPGGALVRAGDSPLEGEWPVHIRATLPDAPGAIAYHTVNGVGVPDIYDGLTLSQTLFGPDGWLTALSHELAETVGDVGTNVLCGDGQGKLYARELCDADEVANYPIELPKTDGTTAVAYVSNFLLPNFFIPNAAGPYDFMTQKSLHAAGERGPKAPFETVPSGGGNYQIVETDPASESQVNAARTPAVRTMYEGTLAHRLEKKMHPASRAYRRGLKITVEMHARALADRSAYEEAQRRVHGG